MHVKSFVFIYIICKMICLMDVIKTVDFSNHEIIDPKIEINYRIGYRLNNPYFYSSEIKNSVKKECIYFFESGFHFYKYAPNGYQPVYLNEEFEIYSSGKSLLIIDSSKGLERTLTLPYPPLWLVSNQSGDTLYYTSEQTSVGDHDLSLLNIFIVEKQEAFTSKVIVDFEGVWYTNEGVVYSCSDYIINKDVNQIEGNQSSLYRMRDIIEGKKEKLITVNNAKILDIDQNGIFYLTYKQRSKYLGSLNCKSRFVVNQDFGDLSFFSNNQLITSFSSVGKQNELYTVIYNDIGEICK